MSTSSAESQATEIVERLRKEVLSTPSGQETGSAGPHAGQWPFLLSDARFRDLRAHRRWGKNWACIFDALGYNLELPDGKGRWMGRAWRLAREKRPNLNPKVVVWFVLPTYILGDELWTDLKAMVPSALVEKTINSKPFRMELRGGIRVEIRSADHPEDLVAAGIDLLYMVEAARIKEAAWLTIRPTLISHGRLGHVAFNSTPKGQNWYARLEDRCKDPEQPDWEGWYVPAFLEDRETRHPMSVIPATGRILAEKDENRQSWFDQEYMAMALAGEGQVFRDVRAHVRPMPSDAVPPIVIGVDLAKRQDFTVFSAFDKLGRQVGIERMHGIAYPVQGERLLGFAHRLGAKKAVIETNGPGDAFIDQLKVQIGETGVRLDIVEFATTASTKSGMINDLALAFERPGAVMLLDDSVQTAEFEAYEATKRPSGNETYGAPEGQHDDMVMAVALAWSELAPRRKLSMKGFDANAFSGLRKAPYRAGGGEHSVSRAGRTAGQRALQEYEEADPPGKAKRGNGTRSENIRRARL